MTTLSEYAQLQHDQRAERAAKLRAKASRLDDEANDLRLEANELERTGDAYLALQPNFDQLQMADLQLALPEALLAPDFAAKNGHAHLDEGTGPWEPAPVGDILPRAPHHEPGEPRPTGLRSIKDVHDAVGDIVGGGDSSPPDFGEISEDQDPASIATQVEAIDPQDSADHAAVAATGPEESPAADAAFEAEPPAAGARTSRGEAQEQTGDPDLDAAAGADLEEDHGGEDEEAPGSESSPPADAPQGVDGLSTYDLQVLKALRSFAGEFVSNAQIAEVADIPSDQALKRALRRLRDRDLAVHNGEGGRAGKVRANIAEGHGSHMRARAGSSVSAAAKGISGDVEQRVKLTLKYAKHKLNLAAIAQRAQATNGEYSRVVEALAYMEREDLVTVDDRQCYLKTAKLDTLRI